MRKKIELQCLRQYDMFANSLHLVKNKEEKDMIIKQLTKLEEKIIALTNDIYEEEYYALANKECGLLEEEKNRITALIELINERLSYVEKRCNNHYQLTSYSIDASSVLGASQLDELENRVKIIDKYSKNIETEKELNEEINSLTSKISLASEKIDINKSLNVELEVTFKKIVASALDKLGLFNLVDRKGDIEYAYYETEKSLTLAELNVETAKTSPLNILPECQKMLHDVTQDYIKYKDQMSTLKLIEIYDRDVNTYEELYAKRKEINEIIKSIKNQELLNLISDTTTKQYNTILMEEQDINTYNDLVLEKERKLESLAEIENENNSEEFQNVLEVLIENERKRQEKILEEKRRAEEEEKNRRLEIERKRQEEILKRQKIIEEARKKEIEKRTKQLLEEQQNSFLQTKKKEKDVNFESIKDNSLAKEEIAEVEEEKTEEKEENNTSYKLNINALKNDISKDEDEEPKENISLFKSKIDIEKELFDEFNQQKEEIEVKQDESIVPKEDDSIINTTIKEEPETIEIEKEEEKQEDKMNENAFPDMSIDEYMRSFNENQLDKNDSFDSFGDEFPTIPM